MWGVGMTDSQRYTGGRYTGGDTMPPFPVMHGSMWKEPQTIEDCEQADCARCAYNLMREDSILVFGVDFCPHREVLIGLKGLI